MTDPIRNVPIRADVIETAKAELLQVYAKLRKAAWSHDYKYTDWLTVSATLEMLGMKESNFKRLTTALRDIGWIGWTTDGKNRRRYFFVELRLAEGQKAKILAPGSSGGINPLIPNEDPLPEEAKILALHNDNEVLDRDSWQAAREAGIGEPNRTLIANKPTVTPYFIKAHAAGARRDGVSIGALIHRLENDWPAPDWCEKCGGLDGEHASDCPTQAERRARESEQARRIEDARRESEPEPMSVEMQAASEAWSKALGELQLQLTGATFDTWLGRTRVVSRENGTFTIGVHNQRAKEWLESRLAGLVGRTLAHIVNYPTEVKFVVMERAGGNGSAQE